MNSKCGPGTGDFSMDYFLLQGKNAIVTGGEGIALLQTDQGNHVLAGLRADPSLAPEDTALTISQAQLTGGKANGPAGILASGLFCPSALMS